MVSLCFVFQLDSLPDERNVIDNLIQFSLSRLSLNAGELLEAKTGILLFFLFGTSREWKRADSLEICLTRLNEAAVRSPLLPPVPIEPLAISELQNRPDDVCEVHNIRPLIYFATLKLWNYRSGEATLCCKSIHKWRRDNTAASRQLDGSS